MPESFPARTRAQNGPRQRFVAVGRGWLVAPGDAARWPVPLAQRALRCAYTRKANQSRAIDLAAIEAAKDCVAPPGTRCWGDVASMQHHRSVALAILRSRRCCTPARLLEAYHGQRPRAVTDMRKRRSSATTAGRCSGDAPGQASNTDSMPMKSATVFTWQLLRAGYTSPNSTR